MTHEAVQELSKVRCLIQVSSRYDCLSRRWLNDVIETEVRPRFLLRHSTFVYVSKYSYLKIVMHTYIAPNLWYKKLLNQTWVFPVHTWFLKIDPVQIVVCVFVSVCLCLCLCLSPCLRPLITSGMMWYDMDLIQLVKPVLQLLFANCSHNEHSLGIGTHRRH